MPFVKKGICWETDGTILSGGRQTLERELAMFSLFNL